MVKILIIKFIAYKNFPQILFSYELAMSKIVFIHIFQEVNSFSHHLQDKNAPSTLPCR